ncbi:binding protein [Tasmannia lanceolata]|uniref:binding protein n=1 Tax=Tasmannia lanceolata TaxID=3420 RepID=UPI004062FB52
MGKKNKIIPPPLLPPEIGEDEIELSDEDLDFVKENREYAGFLKNLDTKSITRHVVRVADQKEDALESLYEKRIRKTSLQRQTEEDKLEVDPVDALPVKTLDGKLYYRTASKESRRSGNISKEDEDASGAKDDDDKDKTVVRLTKAERRTKLKKSKKEAKKQTKEKVKIGDSAQENLQSEVLAEVKEDLSAEEIFVKKKNKLAEIGMALLSDPESNIKSLKELLQICKDEDLNIVKLGLLSLLAIFKDIIPGYRIRLPTEKELEMTVSMEVRKMRYYESTLLSSYKAYLQKLIALEKIPSFKHVAMRCMCNLLDAVPHFNFGESLLATIVKNISSSDDVIRKLCCTTVKSLFANEGKHGGEATVEAVRLIADHVKSYDCQLHPDCIEIFLSLSFDEDLGRPTSSKTDEKVKNKKKRGRQNDTGPEQLPVGDKKRNRKDLLTKIREEVSADFKATSFVPDPEERRRMQTETLSAVFQTYFRILKRSLEPATSRSKNDAGSISGGSGLHPLLSPCLNGLGKFSHLIDLDFMGDLMNSLKMLAGSGGNYGVASPDNCLTISERLQCCIVAFKVMRNNLDALNVDLQEFFVQLYNLLLEYKPDRDNQGEVLAEALKIMLCEGRQHDMQRAAAFVKRLATFSLCFGSAEALAALVTLRQLLQKNIKCRSLLENDAGGGSLSSSIAKYQPNASDPNLSGAFASVLWELSLLSKHYHPTVSSMASSILSMSTSHNQVYLSTASPQEAFADLLIERESFNPSTNYPTLNHKKKRGNISSVLNPNLRETENLADEDEVKKRLSDHFTVLKDIAENERLRGELNHTLSSISMYEEYKRQKKRKVECSRIVKKKGLKVRSNERERKDGTGELAAS